MTTNCLFFLEDWSPLIFPTPTWSPIRDWLIFLPHWLPWKWIIAFCSQVFSHTLLYPSLIPHNRNTTQHNATQHNHTTRNHNDTIHSYIHLTHHTAPHHNGHHNIQTFPPPPKSATSFISDFDGVIDSWMGLDTQVACRSSSGNYFVGHQREP